MKGLLFFLFSAQAFSQVAIEEESKYYKVVEQTMGYTCPAGYYFNPPTKLCYPSPIKEEQVRPEVASKGMDRDKMATVNIYNYANGDKKNDMPLMNIEGVKRRKALDKKQIHAALDKVLDGKWFQEEEAQELDELEEL